ncbi:hypothetical protein XENOCAPTIV_020318 [Xenoophorus captivus]|uniref:NTF2 domain-containing protein n=1 Tax=Xenoophorus captivus TaxID=1517983 RepID=A0ABV0QW42_9TELE
MALSFRDCHTKIRHVDAHATLNEGVVVQVMGELSNNMQPMRKFMQTFVLAPESPKMRWRSWTGSPPLMWPQKMSPEPEHEVEKEVEAAEVELKAEVMLETQTETLTIEDQTEKSPSTVVPPTTEPASAPAEGTPPAPEENRVGRKGGRRTGESRL